MNLKILLVGLVYLYLLWALVVFINKLSRRFSLQWKLLPVAVFDIIFKASIIGLIFSRGMWLLVNWRLVKRVGFWIFPYIKLSGKAYWFSLYPWRAIIFWEGIFWNVVVLWILFIVVIKIIVPAIRVVYAIYKSPDFKVYKVDVYKSVLIIGTLLILPLLLWLI